LSFAGKYLPEQKVKIEEAMNKQIANLTQGRTSDGPKSFVSQIWDYFILVMVLYFLVSIANSLIENYQEQEESDKSENSLKKD